MANKEVLAAKAAARAARSASGEPEPGAPGWDPELEITAGSDVIPDDPLVRDAHGLDLSTDETFKEHARAIDALDDRQGELEKRLTTVGGSLEVRVVELEARAEALRQTSQAAVEEIVGRLIELEQAAAAAQPVPADELEEEERDPDDL